MAAYIVKKILYAILVVWGVITLLFVIFNVVPNDPTRMILGQHTDSLSIAMVKQDLHLDEPIYKQYLSYLDDISPLSVYTKHDNKSIFYLSSEKYSPYKILFNIGQFSIVLKYPYLRRSYQSKKKVSIIISETYLNTLVLATVAIIIATILGLFFGIIAAIFKDSVLDRLILIFTSLGMALPSFFAAIIIGWIFAYLLHKYTGLNLTGNLYEIDDFGRGQVLALKNLILPAITLAIRPVTVITQLTRNSLLETLSQDFIRTAYAKGLSFFKVLTKHALMNSLNPVVTAVSGWFASLLAGVVFVEFIFGWKGLGYVVVDALNNLDFPLVTGIVITISIIFVVVNILVDIIYVYLDPRIKL
jgi:peptide/nickel transport system permease protein